MLPEHISELLTAYVDGELSARQRKAVNRLLKKSPEARKLLKKMQEDSQFLKLLPRRNGADVSDTVVDSIIMQGLKLPIKEAPPIAAPARGVPTWVLVLGAVAVLAGIAAGSFLFFKFTGW